jgi:hypothetical protein
VAAAAWVTDSASCNASTPPHGARDGAGDGLIPSGHRPPHPRAARSLATASAVSRSGGGRRRRMSATVAREACVDTLMAATTAPAWSWIGAAMERSPGLQLWSTIA